MKCLSSMKAGVPAAQSFHALFASFFLTSQKGHCGEEGHVFGRGTRTETVKGAVPERRGHRLSPKPRCVNGSVGSLPALPSLFLGFFL